MLSPDESCVESVDGSQQLDTYRTSGNSLTSLRGTMITEELINYCEPHDVGLQTDAGTGESSNSEISKLGRTEKISSKLDGIAQQHRKHFPRRIYKNAMRLLGRKIIETKTKKIYGQKAFTYIQVLHNTIKKQRNVIKYLKFKIKKLECSAESNYVQSKIAKASPVESNLDNGTQMHRSVEPLFTRVESSDLQRSTFENNDLKNQCINIESSPHEPCDSREVTKKSPSFQSKNSSSTSDKVSKDGGISNIPTNSDHDMYSDETNFVENNLEVEIIEGSSMHIQSDQVCTKYSDVEEVDEEVKKCVQEFMCREDVSVADLTVKTLKPSRFRRHFLGVLFKQFHAEVSSKCSYSQFRKYIPSHVVKPSPTYWKILMCQRCENAELKFMEVVNKILLRDDVLLEEVLAKSDLFDHISQELRKLKNSQEPFTYMTWAKTLLGKMKVNEKIVTTAVGSACTDLLKELDLLKEHLNRCYNQYEAVREAREETEISPIHAIVHIDWYESPATFIARHLHTSYYYGDGFKTLHAGFVRTKENSFGFASLSDCRDHTAPAVWASINDILVSLAKEGMKVITIVSDSATAQYRNKGNFYLMRRFAKQNNVEMKWIYLECGHGKGIADAIGASVKQLMCDVIAHHPDKSFRNTMDILPIIKDLTPIKLFMHTDHLVQQYKNLLSRQHLQVVPSTYKIHEVCVKETSFYVKESSADKLPFFSLDTQLKRNNV